MFARLFLSDLFLHGIGGAKYDELTDRIIQQFFGLVPPTYLVLSATYHLPIARPSVSPHDDRRVNRLLRDLEFNPDRHVDRNEIPQNDRPAHDEIERLIATKRRWIETEQTPENAYLRHVEITRANRQLQPWVEDRRQELLGSRDRIVRDLHSEAILSSREFAFCLHPEETLSRLILELREQTS